MTRFEEYNIAGCNISVLYHKIEQVADHQRVQMFKLPGGFAAYMRTPRFDKLVTGKSESAVRAIMERHGDAAKRVYGA